MTKGFVASMRQTPFSILFMEKYPHCGYPALIMYVQENNMPLPLTPEHELEIR